jgi:hypothetical protein
VCLKSVIAPLVLVLLLLTLPNVVLIHHLLPSRIFAVRPPPAPPLLPRAAFPFLRTVAAVVEFLQGFSNVRARVYAHGGSAGISMLS